MCVYIYIYIYIYIYLFKDTLLLINKLGTHSQQHDNSCLIEHYIIHVYSPYGI